MSADPFAEGVRAERERAAELLAHACPTGFSSPKDNERCCGILEALIEDIENGKPPCGGCRDERLDRFVRQPEADGSQ